MGEILLDGRLKSNIMRMGWGGFWDQGYKRLPENPEWYRICRLWYSIPKNLGGNLQRKRTRMRITRSKGKHGTKRNTNRED